MAAAETRATRQPADADLRIPRAPQLPNIAQVAVDTSDHAPPSSEPITARPGSYTSEVTRLRDALDDERQQSLHHEQALATLRGQHESMRSLLAVRATRITELQDTIDERDRHLASAQRRLGEQLSAQRGLELKLQQRLSELAEAREQLSRLERELEALRAVDPLTMAATQPSPEGLHQDAPVTSPSPVGPDDGDDLRRIHGIGPKYARALKALGVSRFAQIAAWTDSDVERIASAMSIRPTRITKRDWRIAARELIDSV